MTQEQKQLLLKDLCARLPYFDNWIQYEGKDYIVTGYGHGRVSLLPSLFSSSVGPCPLIEEVKPYLRPMSSMTEKEKEEFIKEASYITEESINGMHSEYSLIDAVGTPENPGVNEDAIDWLNEHHFDYRNLIEKGLALEAPDDMYK